MGLIMSKQSKYSDELKNQILKEVEEVGVIDVVARKHGIDPKNIHNWLRARKNKPKLDQARELRELRKKLDDAELENLVLKELLKKNLLSLAERRETVKVFLELKSAASIQKICHFAEFSRTQFYYNFKNNKIKSPEIPWAGFTINRDGQALSDYFIVKHLKN